MHDPRLGQTAAKLLSRYKDDLIGMTAPEEESKKSFLKQLASHVHSLIIIYAIKVIVVH